MSELLSLIRLARTFANTLVVTMDGYHLDQISRIHSVQGKLFSNSREIFYSPQYNCVLKLEHSVNNNQPYEPYQCWNERVLWDEHIPQSEYSEWFAPTLAMGVVVCPVHEGCVAAISVEQYINDEGRYRAGIYVQPQEIEPILARFPILIDDLAGNRAATQCVYDADVGHARIVDYGYVGAYGYRLPSEGRPEDRKSVV